MVLFICDRLFPFLFLSSPGTFGISLPTSSCLFSYFVLFFSFCTATAKDTHQYYAFPPLANLSRPEILSHICAISALVKNTSIAHPIVVGEFNLETNSSPDSEDDEESQRSNNHRGPSQAQRTWYRLLFEAQVAAYSPSEESTSKTPPAEQPIKGWYFWTWKTEWEIDTWSYRRGWQDGWIPSDVGNQSTFAFPLLDNGCVDEQFGYEAPEQVGMALRPGMVGFWWLAGWTLLVGLMC